MKMKYKSAENGKLDFTLWNIEETLQLAVLLIGF